MSLPFCSLLVNIYGSREVFVSEYRNLLADRLLQSLAYDTSREVSLVLMSILISIISNLCRYAILNCSSFDLEKITYISVRL